MRDLIFVSLENWDQVWRRNQFICATLLKRFPNMRLLFVERARDFSNAVRMRQFSGFRRPALRQSSEFPGLTMFSPLKLLPNSIAGARQINARMLRQQLRRVSSEIGFNSPLLWMNDHFAAHLCGHLGERGVVYDVTDDWTVMPSTGASERARIIAADRDLCERADLVVVCSQSLEESRKPAARRVVRIPNGVDAAHYRSCTRTPLAAREVEPGVGRTQSAGAPVFGYLGTLHGDRLDTSLVLALADRWPGGRVVLCGPDFLSPIEHRKLKTRANIEISPAVPYAEVPKVMAGFDVCILPHRCNAFTESLNPIKLWEYLASGKPIASTPVAGFRDFSHLCNLGDGVDGFLDACRSALEEDPAIGLWRIKEAEGHSWEHRVDDLLEVFRQQGWLGSRGWRSRRVPPGVRQRNPVRHPTTRVCRAQKDMCHG
jgi:glycosyltransferase involved in cell wall biosynthesis